MKPTPSIAICTALEVTLFVSGCVTIFCLGVPFGLTFLFLWLLLVVTRISVGVRAIMTNAHDTNEVIQTIKERLQL